MKVCVTSNPGGEQHLLIYSNYTCGRWNAERITFGRAFDIWRDETSSKLVNNFCRHVQLSSHRGGTGCRAVCTHPNDSSVCHLLQLYYVKHAVRLLRLPKLFFKKNRRFVARMQSELQAAYALRTKSLLARCGCGLLCGHGHKMKVAYSAGGVLLL